MRRFRIDSHYGTTEEDTAMAFHDASQPLRDLWDRFTIACLHLCTRLLMVVNRVLDQWNKR